MELLWTMLLRPVVLDTIQEEPRLLHDLLLQQLLGPAPERQLLTLLWGGGLRKKVCMCPFSCQSIQMCGDTIISGLRTSFVLMVRQARRRLLLAVGFWTGGAGGANVFVDSTAFDCATSFALNEGGLNARFFTEKLPANMCAQLTV